MRSPAPPGAKAGAGPPGCGPLWGQLWAHHHGLAQQQGLPQLLRLHFCQTLIQHLISTFIKCYFFKKTKQMASL